MKKKRNNGRIGSSADVPKIYRIMKLTCFFILVALLQVSAATYSQNTKLSIEGKNLSIEKILGQIEDQSEYSFFYNNKEVDLSKIVTVDIKDKEIDEVLGMLMNEAGLDYTLNNKLIIIHQNEKGKFSNLSVQQAIKVSGTITNEGGEPIPGATVVVKGTTVGTIADFEGYYTLGDVPADGTLVYSFVGMKSQEVPVQGRQTINVAMQEETIGLEEVVAVGYGTIKKRDLTGSVGSVDSETLVEKGTTSPMEAIQGSLAGVQITSSTGRIGDGFDITIRGKNSMSADAKPLYVVDGVPTDGIDFLNPQDIARVDVLKDASSTAIYGSRGSNGVVIVTTKSGGDVKKDVSVSYSGYYGIRKAARLPEMMSGEKWWYYHQSAYLATAKTDPVTGTVTEATLQDAVGAGGNNNLLYERAARNETTDWYDVVLKDGQQQNHYVAISGKTNNKLGYTFGIGYQNEEGNIQNESIDKYSFKMSVNQDISEKVDFGTNFSASLTEQEMGSEFAMREAFRLNPFLSPVDSVGNLYPQPGKYKDADGNWLINKTSTFNPVLEIQNSTNNVRRWNGVGNTYLSYMPIEWLTLKSSFSFNYDANRQGQAWGALTNNGISNNNLPSAQRDTYENFSYTWDNQFNIERKYDKHSFNLLGVQSFYSSVTETSMMYSKYMPFETTFHNLGSGEQGTYNISSAYIKQTLTSYSFRLNYSYNDRLLITLSNRWDGSSLLSEGNKWESFPSGAIAWRVSEEPFLANSDLISNLKARVSYGFTGNNIVSPYATSNTLDRQMYYDYFGSAANGWLPQTIANSKLTWEKTSEINVGVDFGLFSNSQVYGSIDVYNRLSDDLLMPQQLPKESGWNEMDANVGSVRNRGIEVALTTVNIDKNDFYWKTSFTFTSNKNTIESLYGQDKVDDVGNGWFIGESVDAQYNYKFDGIWQASEAAEAAIYGQSEGQAKVVDVNNNDDIDPADDRMILGSSDPSWSASMNSSLSYKNFDFSFSLYGNQGVFVNSGFHSNFVDVRDRGRNKLDIADWYIPANDAGLPAQVSNEYPQPRNAGTYWRNDGVGYYRDASFVKIKNIALGYSLKPQLAEELHMKSCRIYMNILNPFVFTSYDGYDPEWAGASYNDGGVGSVIYQIGVNVNF
jgi:TonB-linked SusC/RagA family outer membrane protein